MLSHGSFAHGFERSESLTEKFVRAQLNILKPLIEGSSIEQARKEQDLIGDLMALTSKSSVSFEKRSFDNFDVEWVIPESDSNSGVIMYLHGGGYTCGGLEYAKGFGSKLAASYGMKVLCCAYRLAPENKFPCPVEDALEAYNYLIANGFSPKRIILCGESAGGGLCYSLCIKLNSLGIEQPAGIIAISPWTDLTSSGQSYEENASVDPSMTKQRLQMFADCYTTDKTDPLASPLFFENMTFPPSIIFAGGDEVMLDDSKMMYEKLVSTGSKSKLVIAPRMWHAYILYDIREYKSHYAMISSFIQSIIPQSSPRWARLDNAAKIFPASRRRGWYNMFRLSATLNEPVSPEILQSALNVTIKRFPMIAARLKTGFFWYYLEEVKNPPQVMRDSYQPLMLRPFEDMRKCAIRVLYYQNRIAVEFFHAVTDGTGGMVFLKTLVAEYLTQKYKITIKNEKGVMDRLAYPDPEELEDSFLNNTGAVSAKRSEGKSYKLMGTPEPDRFLHLTLGCMDVSKVRKKAKEYGLTLTGFLSAVMLKSIADIQKRKVKKMKNRLPVKIQIPVNLRNLFESRTMRNFVMVVNIGIDPRMGDYSFDEIANVVKHQMGLFITKKYMQSVFTPNVKSESLLAIRMVPLFLKNIIMKAVFDSVGEAQACLSLSNLGAVDIPDEMKPYVKAFDFIIGPQAAAPYNCGVCSYAGELRINFIRRSVEPELEREFFTNLVKMGLKVSIESNQRDED